MYGNSYKLDLFWLQINLFWQYNLSLGRLDAWKLISYLDFSIFKTFSLKIFSEILQKSSRNSNFPEQVLAKKISCKFMAILLIQLDFSRDKLAMNFRINHNFADIFLFEKEKKSKLYVKPNYRTKLAMYFNIYFVCVGMKICSPKHI